jgi:ubiquinol-cytochrome c reductase cytochrome b subunit
VKRRLGAIQQWIDNRTGIATAVQQFLYEEIPASSGWHQVFGSLAVFLFLTQALTGVLLAFNYAPLPGDSYNSLRYILTELTAGRLMRGLHHWGASMMIIVVVVHMTQVFLWGAYKKPRETTWIVGIFLLLLTMAYGLTGYLLPWDNRAYWGTVVTTQIVNTVPVLGPYLGSLLGGTGAIGVVTFVRFYGLHVLLLPPLTMLLIGFHIYLVRKHGVAPVPGDELLPRKRFYPRQVFIDSVAIFVLFAILFVMAVAVRVPLGQLADPTDISFTPRPEWYFLFLFQLLKLMPGPLEIVGSVILPGLAVTALILLPFFDRGQMVKVTRRTFAFAAVLLAALGWSGLTAAAVIATPEEAKEIVDYSAPTDWMQLAPEELAGVGYFRQEKCTSCHTVAGRGPSIGPDLAHIAKHRNAAWMIDHFKNPSAMRPGTSMPPIALDSEQMNSLAAFLLKLDPDNASGLLNETPEFAIEGAMVFQKRACINCHRVNGNGMSVGPPLNGLARRHTKDWVKAHFSDPKKLSPGSIMPAYKFSPAELENVTTYLFALPSDSN